MTPAQHAVAYRTVRQMVERTRVLIADGPGLPPEAVASAAQKGILAVAPPGAALVDYVAALAAVAVYWLALTEEQQP